MRGCLASSSVFLAERKVGEQNCSAGLIKILFEAWWSANCPQKIKTLVQANGFLLHIKYSLIEAQKLCKLFLRNVTKKTPHRRGIQGKLFKFKEKNVVMTQGKCFLPCAREGGGCGIREMGGSPSKKKTSDEQLLLQASACRIMPDVKSIWCTANKALTATQTSAAFCTSSACLLANSAGNPLISAGACWVLP